MIKNIAIAVGLLVVVVAVGIYYFASNAGKFVETAIEEQGSRVTKVDVALDAVDLSLTELKAGLRGLTVGNPAGFKTDRAVSLGEVSVKIGKDWSKDLIVIDEVMVRAPEITYEIGGSGSNIAAIQENVQNFMDAIGGGKSSSDTSGGDEGGPKVVINNFYIKDGKVNVSSTLLQGQSLSTPLPNIHLKDIGKKSNGASPAEVVEQIIAAITKSSSGAASSLDLSKLGLADISGKASEMGKAAADTAKKALEGASGGAKGAADGAAGAIKGLFGN